ncbi:PKD domain-containing protein [Methanosphaerula palustris]|nr:PKD domain-containing protein [Methanosphaerula palustris]
MRWVLLMSALVAVCCTPVYASSLFTGAPSPTSSVPNTVSEFSVSYSADQYQRNLTIPRSDSFFDIAGMAVDAPNRTLFVTTGRYIHQGYPESYNLTVIDTTTMQQVTTVPMLDVMTGVSGSAFDSGHNRLYVYSSDLGSLFRYVWDSTTQTLTLDGDPIGLSDGCSAFAVDPVEDVLYVVTYSGTIQRYSTVSGSRLEDLTLPEPMEVNFLTVDEVNHCLYMWAMASDSTIHLVCLNPTSNLLTQGDTITGAEVTAQVVDPASHYLYVGTTRKVSDGDDPLMIPEIRVYDSSLRLKNTIPAGPSDLIATKSDHLLEPVYLAIISDGIVPPTPTPTPTSAITAGFYAFGHVGQAPYPVRFLDQSTGSPTAWKWDFGDNTTSTEQSPTHIYNQTGAFNVALTASNDQASDTCTQYRCVIVNTVPAANFTANATAGRTPFTVQFTDQSTGATGYQWQFGDGTTSTEQNPVHTYTTPGSYSVMLTVSEPNYGSVYTQKPGYITVTDPPTVGFSANVTAGLAPLAVQFNESTNGSVQYYYWQFGDGGTSFDQNPVHIYTNAGSYTVSLYAIGSNGTEAKTVDQYITVTSPVTPTPTTPAPVNTTTVPTTLVPTATVTLVPTNTTVVPTVTTVAPTVTGSAYNGPHTIPGTLQAEDYDLGGEGVAYHDTTLGNEGGVYRHDDVDIEQLDTDGSPNVGWIRAGEWLAYTVNVSTAGTYNAGFRVASSHSGSSIQVYVDNGTTPVATVSVPNTGDWPVFRTVSVPVTLPAGQHRLRLSFPTDYVNINWISFT